MYFQKRCVWSVLILVLTFAFAAEAADVTGSWAIQDLQIANKVQLSLNVIQGGRGSFNSSSAFDVFQFRGLTPAQMATPIGTMARFELVREAGTFAFEGYFKAGNGAGTFLFRSDPGFVPAMRAQGFLDVDESRIFSMAVHDVGPRFASEIRAAGITPSTAAKLLTMRIHGVSLDFIRDIQRAGYKPEEEDLIKMRIHRVTPEFANEVRRMYGSASIEHLVKMQIHRVDLDFAGEVRQMFPTASIDDLVRLRIHRVTMDYIRNIQSRSRDISLDQLVRLKIRGIQ
jgi:hypothetical protein